VQDKQREFADAPFGVVGLETALPLTLTLVEEGTLSLETAVAKLTTEPARAFGLAKGSLAPGADADLVLVDPQQTWEVDPAKLRSKSKNTPFAGWKVKGRVTTTVVGGKVVYELT
jgi:dihydroorotase